MTGVDEFRRAEGRASLAQRLRSGEQLLGTLLRMPNETLVEMTGLVGMDFVVLDTEHGPGDQIPLGQHLMAAAAAGIPALVRVGSISEILRVLDLGAAGIIAPHISTVAQAEAVVRAASYPPRGDRGFATYSRSGRHGLTGTAEHLRNAAANTAIVLMIEDGPGAAAAEEIAGVAGVDGLFVGPADLAVALGVPGAQAGPQVREVIATVHDAARRSGVAVVSIAADAAAAREQFDAGSTAVMYNTLAALGKLFTQLAGGRSPSVPARARESANGALVLLPGMFSTARVWDAVVARLPPTLHVAALRIDRDETVADMAESVLAQAPERFCLAGHSLGGIVALEVARRAPHRLSGLVLLNCSGRGPSDTQLAEWAAMADRTSAGDFDAVVAEHAVISLGDAANDESAVAAWTADARLVGPQGLLRELAAQQTRPDSLPQLPAVRVPTMVISGERDAVSPPDLQRELAAGIPDARLVTLPTAGHLSPVDSPTDIAALISEFLSGPG